MPSAAAAVRWVDMLLIFGLTVRARPMEAGRFHCPNEGGDRTYTMLELRRWFTLFFIPLIPLKLLGDVVECDSCRRQFDRSTLRMPTSATMEHKIEVAARSVLGAVAAAAPAVEKAAVRELDSFLGAPAYCAHDLAQTPRFKPTHKLPKRSALDPAGREGLLMATARGGMVDDEIDPSLRAILTEAGAALGMTPAHIEGVMVVASRAVV